MATGRYTIKWIERRLGKYAESTTTQGLLFIPVLVIYPYQTSAEGEDFAKGDEDGVMYLAQWWAEEARGKHYAPEGAQCSSGDELEVFHGLGSYLPLITLIFHGFELIQKL